MEDQDTAHLVNDCRGLLNTYKKLLVAEQSKLQQILDASRKLTQETTIRLTALPLNDLAMYEKELQRQEQVKNVVNTDLIALFAKSTKDLLQRQCIEARNRQKLMASLSRMSLEATSLSGAGKTYRIVADELCPTNLKLAGLLVADNLAHNLTQKEFECDESTKKLESNNNGNSSTSNNTAISNNKMFAPDIAETRNKIAAPVNAGSSRSVMATTEIKYSDMAKKVDKAKEMVASIRPPVGSIHPHCYMDLEIDGELIGRAIIRLNFGKAPYMSENFMKLCAFPRGGYRGCRFFRFKKDIQVIGGDNENNDGTGGRSCYPDLTQFMPDQSTLTDDKGCIRMICSEKAYDGRYYVSSQFMVWVGEIDFRTFKYSLVFGQVVEGLDLFATISRIPMMNNGYGWVPKQEAVIADCGVF